MSLLPSSLYIMRLTLGYYPKCSPLSLPFLNLCPTPSWRSERKLDCCIHNQSPLVCKDIRLRKNVHNRWGDAFQMSADENFFCRFSHIYQDLWICGWCRKVDLSEGGNWICTSSTSSSQSSLMSRRRRHSLQSIWKLQRKYQNERSIRSWQNVFTLTMTGGIFHWTRWQGYNINTRRGKRWEVAAKIHRNEN